MSPQPRACSNTRPARVLGIVRRRGAVRADGAGTAAWSSCHPHSAGPRSRRMNAIAMIDLQHIDELARRLSNLVPPSMRSQGFEDLRDELQENFKSVLQAGLSKLDLVTREEFEVQRAVLLRTREKLDELQRTVADLEAQQTSTTQR